MIEIKDTLTLNDNNEYVVASRVNYNEKIYYYLIDINNNSNIKFCYQDGEELVELNDKKLTTKLLPLFLDVAKKDLNIN